MRDKFDAAVGVSAERESSLDAEFFSSEGRGDIHQLGFPVIKHLPQVAGGFESLFVDAPFLFEHIPVDFRLVDSLPLGFLRHGCLRLIRCLLRWFRRGFCLLGLLDFQSRERHIDLVIFEYLGIRHRVFGEVADYGAHRVVSVGGYAEESECRGVLALAHEVRHKSFERVLAF